MPMVIGAGPRCRPTHRCACCSPTSASRSGPGPRSWRWIWRAASRPSPDDRVADRRSGAGGAARPRRHSGGVAVRGSPGGAGRHPWAPSPGDDRGRAPLPGGAGDLRLAERPLVARRAASAPTHPPLRRGRRFLRGAAGAHPVDGAGSDRDRAEHRGHRAVPRAAWPGRDTTHPLRGLAPSQPGEYILRATIVQEGWRWLDAMAPAVYADVPVLVTPSSPVQM